MRSSSAGGGAFPELVLEPDRCPGDELVLVWLLPAEPRDIRVAGEASPGFMMVAPTP
jgi:hypothetical protein